jgi:CRISPR-associated protein Csb2
VDLTFVVRVFVLGGRFHGADWPPSPARLFQALVAGVGLEGPLKADVEQALDALQKLDPPRLAHPASTLGQSVLFYMPNNDIDSAKTKCDVRKVSLIRGAQKVVEPRIFDESKPFVYAWRLPKLSDQTIDQLIASWQQITLKLYQFGRGVDMAWATGHMMSEDELARLIEDEALELLKPNMSGDGELLSCPVDGSLQSLTARFRANQKRFQSHGSQTLFTQAPKPRFVEVPYNSTRLWHLFELRSTNESERLVPWPQAAGVALVTAARDAAVKRLVEALPTRQTAIEQVLIGRRSPGAPAGLTDERARIVPLPSIGHQHTNRSIRRLLVETAADGALDASDIQWAFSGAVVASPLNPADSVTLTPSSDRAMLDHYGIRRTGSRRWRTVTPAVLPRLQRSDSDVSHSKAMRRDGKSQRAIVDESSMRVLQALRHAGITERPLLIRVQREPFDSSGLMSSEFAGHPRFERDAYWHVELEFAQSVTGPLLLGDGRFLGLGLMAPTGAELQGVFSFAVDALETRLPDPLELSQALRRATMARVQAMYGKEPMPAYFTGHAEDGTPATGDRASHLTFAFDAERQRLLVIAPHIVGHYDLNSRERGWIARLDAALADLRELRAGRNGLLRLRPLRIDPDSDPLFRPSNAWQSATAYLVTRHGKRSSAEATLTDDLKRECLRGGFPAVEVTEVQSRARQGVGLFGDAKLNFATAVRGPVILGKTRYFGGGLFIAADEGREHS